MRRRQALIHCQHSSLIGANLARKVSLNKDYITVTRLDSTTPTVSNPYTGQPFPLQFTAFSIPISVHLFPLAHTNRCKLFHDKAYNSAKYLKAITICQLLMSSLYLVSWLRYRRGALSPQSSSTLLY